MRRARATALPVLLALVALPLLPVAAATAPTSVLVIDGRGHGHGVGMAQDSANAMAAAGATHEQVLGLFYPGTSRARRSSALRVAVWEAGAPFGSVTVAVPGGARVSGGGRAADAPPGAVLRVTADATGYAVRQVAPGRGAPVRAGLLQDASPSPTPSPSPSDGPPIGTLPSPTASPTTEQSPTPAPSSAPPGRPSPAAPGASPSPTASSAPAFSFDSASPVTLAPAGGAGLTVLTTGRRYRGSLIALSRSGFRLVNVLDVEEYLRGLGEVPASWPMAALRAQAVAARTYALRSVGTAPLGYDICDDTRCQVYLGMSAESPRTTAAARETRGEVVTYRGALADTFYSANAGGVTATPAEGFGGSVTLPYLPGGVRAPGDVDAWRLAVSPQDVARRLRYPGRLDALTVVATGPSGRATRVRLDGTAGAVELGGVDVQRRLGLRSTLFSVTRGTGAAQALPPASAAAVQLAPEAAAAAPAVPEPSSAPSAAPLPSLAPLPALAGTRARPQGVPAPLLAAAVAPLATAAAGVLLAARAPLRRRRSAA